MRACAAGPKASSGARSISRSTSKRWRSGRSRSQGSTSAMPRCYPACSTRSPTQRRDRLGDGRRGQRHAQVPQCHPTAAPMPSSRPTRTPSHGRPSPPVPQALRALQCLSRALWQRWSGYHRRSRVEPKMHCMKQPGQRLMARNFERQVAGL